MASLPDPLTTLRRHFLHLVRAHIRALRKISALEQRLAQQKEREKEEEEEDPLRWLRAIEWDAILPSSPPSETTDYFAPFAPPQGDTKVWISTLQGPGSQSQGDTKASAKGTED